MQTKQQTDSQGMPKRVGVIGGAFNPIHNGHIMIAASAKEQFSLDQVLFIPTGHSPYKHKQQITDAADRCAMVSLAIGSYPCFALDKIEVESSETSYTYVTLGKLKEKLSFSELFFVLGADSLFGFEDWKNPELILNNCKILAAYRKYKRENEFFCHISYLNRKYPGKFYPLDTPTIAVSSQEIRQRVRDGKTIHHLVPGAVETYIKNNKLYLN